MSTRPATEPVELPAGDYWVGDPCYFIHDDSWHDWLEAAGIHRRTMPDPLVAPVPGSDLVAVGVGTAWGDGTYQDDEGFSYGVDAGLLGVVPAAAVTELKVYAAREGRLVTFTEPFTVWRSPSGVVMIGHLAIPTD